MIYQNVSCDNCQKLHSQDQPIVEIAVRRGALDYRLKHSPFTYHFCTFECAAEFIAKKGEIETLRENTKT